MTISKPFCLAVHEGTQPWDEKGMGIRPLPGKQNAFEGVEYRLLTEPQWAYACRLGTTTVCSFGDDAAKLGQHVRVDVEVGEDATIHDSSHDGNFHPPESLSLQPVIG